MELQPIVGSPCAHCKERILVDADGKNCARCGLALHRRCGKAHRAECANKPALAHQARDYDEVAPLAFTPRLTALLALGTFLLLFGLGMLSAGVPEAPAGEAPAQPSKARVVLAWGSVAVGLALAGGGYAFERSRQRRKAA